MKTQFYDYKKDGITQGLLSTFMTCRQKARLFLEGWSKPHDSMGLTYGTIIHGVLEHTYEAIRTRELNAIPSTQRIKKYTNAVEKQWYKENPKATKYSLENLQISLLIAEATLPVYFEYWWKEDFKEIKWLKLEQKFSIPYKTKDGRKTLIKGKKDGIFGNPNIYLFETKTKSMLNEADLVDTLWFELQVNLYLWAIRKMYKQVPAGVNYNIIRRTCLPKKKSESMPLYAKRIVTDIKKRPDFYFIRLEIKIAKEEMDEWEKELEAMVVDFMNWYDGKVGHYKNTNSCITKYGRCEYLNICSEGKYQDYTKRSMVFRELEDM